MNKVRMRALKDFSRRIDGHIIVGNPDHPDEEGRILHVTPAVADVLEAEDLAEEYSEKDQARDEADAEKRGGAADNGSGAGGDDAAAGIKPGAVKDVVKALTKGAGGAKRTPRRSGSGDTLDPNQRESSQAARDRRTDTSGSANGGRRRAPARGKAPAPGERGGAPVGGTETNASTNQPTSAVNGDGTSASETNKGASGTPDPDAAPTA